VTGVFEVENPATREVIAEVPDAGAFEAARAVDCAASALPGWAATPPRARSEVLHRTHELMLRESDRLVDLIAEENGKSTTDAAAEVAYAAEFFRWFAEEAGRLKGEFQIAPAGGTRTIVTHRPAGIAALITPWNFPAAMATRKLAPALGAGCTVLLKPAAETPLTALAVAELLTEAGLPPGVLTVVTTTAASAVVGAWLDDPRVRKVSFTGSTEVGRTILRHAADRVVNSSMELGGNAPFVVCPDADLDEAVTGAMIAKFRNGGQACTAANRFYIHSDVAEEFTARFGAHVAALSVGPASEGNAVGPLISASAQERVTRLVEEAVCAGARISHRAQLEGQDGYFYPPTVLVDVPPTASIVVTESFAPVAPILTWSTTRDLLEQVNASESGLAGYVFSRDLQKALQLAESMELGMVGINRGIVSDPAAPFGGVKQSGLGREGAQAGIREYLETQYFSVNWSAG
jgi:succinate-semialdehyde dehydrogenase/glutarate-semialdehyde dehydrogenase